MTVYGDQTGAPLAHTKTDYNVSGKTILSLIIPAIT